MVYQENTALASVPWNTHMGSKQGHMGTSLTPDFKNSLAGRPSAGPSATSKHRSAGGLDRVYPVKEGKPCLTIVRATSWGRSPRTSASRPGTTHGVSTSMDGGARGCPVSSTAWYDSVRHGSLRHGSVRLGLRFH